MFFNSRFQKGKAPQGIIVTVLSREKMTEMAMCLPKRSCVISINTPGAEHLPIPAKTLYLDFPDTESDAGMTESDAVKVAAFVEQNVEDGNNHIYVHCDQGVSRSAGTAAAILRAYGQDESQILDCNEYCINGRCYEFVLSAFHVFVTDDEVSMAKQRSKSAYMRSWPML